MGSSEITGLLLSAQVNGELSISYNNPYVGLAFMKIGQVHM